MSSAQPLEALRVLGFGHYTAGPLASVFSADQAAAVISVVRPDTKTVTADVGQTLARAKQICAIDLKDPAGHERDPRRARL